MKKIYLILAMILTALTAINAQNSSDTITIKKVTGGYQYLKGDIPLTMPQLTKEMASDPVAFEKIKKASTTFGFVSVLSYAGGFCIGYPIGTMLGGGEPQWVLAGIGAVMVAIALPIAKNVDSHTRQAVEIYNTGKQKTSFWDNTELRLSMTENGVGFALRF